MINKEKERPEKDRFDFIKYAKTFTFQTRLEKLMLINTLISSWKIFDNTQNQIEEDETGYEV